MNAAAKIIESGIAPQPAALGDEIRRQLEALSRSLQQLGEQAIERITAAESAAIGRLNEYVPQERLLDTREAATYLHVPVRTLNSWTPAKNPQVTFTWLGNRKRFRKEHLDNFSNRRLVRHQPVSL